MNPTTISHLLELNRQFYQTFALPFSATRSRLQPGVRRILEIIPVADRLLDLGCGNGELARELAKRGHTGPYIGLDFSSTLLEKAMLDQPSNLHFFQADLSTMDWDTSLKEIHSDLILAFAVLHHIPSQELRLQIVKKAKSLLAQGGCFIHSEWQFLNSPRLKERIQPWEIVGLKDDDVDPGDYLLDWRQGGTGYRYVHHFSEEELATLAHAADFVIAESFYSDGQTGHLGLYQLWK